MRRDYFFAIAGAITCSLCFPLVPLVPLVSLSAGSALALQEDVAAPVAVGDSDSQANQQKSRGNQYDASEDLQLPGGEAVSQVLQRIQSELDKGQLTQESVNQVAELTQKFPGNYKLHLYYGLCLDEVGLPDEALEQFRLADKLGPRDPRGTVGILNHLLSRGDQKAANILLDEALKRFPNTPEINYFLGKVLKDNGRYAEAEKVFTRAYRSGHRIFRLPTELGELLQNKNPQLAIKLADEDLEQHPNYYRALQVKGTALLNMGEFSLALEPFKNLFSQSPAYGRFAEYYSRCLFWSGNYRDAVQPGLYYLAQQAQEVGGPLPAQHALVTVLRHFNRDFAAKQIDEFYASVAKSNRSVQAMVKPAFHYYLASILENVPRPDLAMVEWQKYLQSNPNSFDALYHLGILQENYKHDYAAAYKLYSQAHGLAPHDGNAYNAYVRMLERLSNSSEDWAQSLRDWLVK